MDVWDRCPLTFLGGAPTIFWKEKQASSFQNHQFPIWKLIDDATRVSNCKVWNWYERERSFFPVGQTELAGLYVISCQNLRFSLERTTSVQRSQSYKNFFLKKTKLGSPQIVAGALPQIGHNKLLYLVENYCENSVWYDLNFMYE